MAYIKLDKADQLFSQYRRLTQRECQRCGSPVGYNEKGLPVTHQNSHFYGRGKESTRFELSNCDVLCYACHVKWGSEDREAYRQFKLNQLGEDGYKKLEIQAAQYKKKDRKLEAIRWKAAIEAILSSNSR